MKATYLQAAGAIALTFGIAACVPSAEPLPPPPPPVATPTPTPAPPPPPPVVEQPQYENYLDAPQTAGTWSYYDEPGETLAVFAVSTRNPTLIVRCDKAARKVGIARSSLAPGTQPMKIETETATRNLTASALGQSELIAVELDPYDPLLDAMAITKGRFAISSPRDPTLYIPAWVEVSRVIEDCR